MILLILLLLGGNYDSTKSTPKSVTKITKTMAQFKQPIIAKKEVEENREAKLEVALKDTLLEGQESVFVEVADQYDFDYRLLPAISFSESGLCDRFIRSTWNCFGWGSGQISFESFEDAIRTIGYKLATLSYYEAWRQDKDIMTLAKTYCGVDNEHWVEKINYFKGGL